MSPKGEVLTQQKVEQFASEISECIILCGHYEGIDERIIEIFVSHQVSIGNYILSGGELATQVFLDTIIRHIPTALGNPLSLEEESFSKKLEGKLEYPIYTRPQNFRGKEVPPVLISGNHKEIESWKFSHLKKL